jgi:hypothetical protein
VSSRIAALLRHLGQPVPAALAVAVALLAVSFSRANAQELLDPGTAGSRGELTRLTQSPAQEPRALSGGFARLSELIEVGVPLEPQKLDASGHVVQLTSAGLLYWRHDSSWAISSSAATPPPPNP